MGWRRVVAMFATGVVLFGAGPAAADDSGVNKEGFWTVGRGAAGAKGCMASTIARDGTMLLLQVAPGHVDFAVGTKKPMRRGKAGVLTLDAASFDFAPDYNDERDVFFFEDENARALAALRQARGVAVQVDGREVLNVSLENTGLEGALDALIACSEGKSGWWGPGLGASVVAETAEPEPALNKEGFWSLSADGDMCAMTIRIEGDLGLVVIATSGGRDVMVGAAGAGAGFKRGRKGVFATDAYSFPFKPDYGGDGYLQLDRFLDSQALFALQRARSVTISVDGREVVSVELADTGFAGALADLGACSRGEKGWWGEGAKKP